MSNTFLKSLLAGAAALLVACNSDQIASLPLGAPTHIRPSESTEPPQGALATAYTQTFVRHAGRPDNYAESLDLSRYEGEFVMTVTNGDGSGNGRIRAGSFAVDGVTLLSNSDLAGSQTTFTFTFTFASAPQTLAVTALGAPNGYLHVEIKGHERRWRVCPGESYYRTYETVQAAVAAADAGATIWVCDGTHYAAAVVNKPLTIRPEHSGAVTLRDTLPWSPSEASPSAGGPSPIFWVEGLTQGTFRVVDFDMVLMQSALVTTGDWTRVEMDSIRITSVDSTHTTAVRSFAGTDASDLEFTRSSVTAAGTGVLAAGGVVNVSNVSFDRDGQPILYTGIVAEPLTAATGRVQYSSFNSCSLGGCVRVVARGGVTISGNTFTKGAGSPTGAAIQVRQNFQLGVPQLPVLIEDNVFVGVPSATPNVIPSWTLSSALQVLNGDPTFPAGSIAFVGNQVTEAGAGIAVNSANGTSVDAHDNTITGVFSGITTGNSNGGGVFFVPKVNLRFVRNDVTGSANSFLLVPGNTGSTVLTCNWWGSAAGPLHPDARIAPSVYTPWAAQPIAGHSEIGCP